MKNKFIKFGIILICLATVAMGVQTFAAGGMSLIALKGPLITDLYIAYEDSTLNNADRVKITTYYINNSKKYTDVYSNVAIINGVSTISLSDLEQNEIIFVEVTIGNGKSRIDMSGQTIVKLRPDLTIQSLSAPPLSLNTSYFNVDVNVTELNGETGANFTLVIKEGEAILASEPSQVTAAGSVSLSIPLLIDQVGPHTLSAIIINSDPAEYSTSNNQQDFTIEITRPLQKPDLTIQSLNAPLTSLNTNYFNVDVNVTELNGETGANFTLLIKEGEVILASEPSQVTAGGSVSLSIPLLIGEVDSHNLSAVIVNSDPAEDSLYNNQQNFTIDINQLLLNPADYTTWYYFQNDTYRNSKNLNSAADGGTHIEVSDYLENKISERFFYNLTINKELIFPIDSIFIQLYNESGIVEEHEITNIIPTKIEIGKTVASLYYPDTGSTITIIAKSGSTEIKLEKRARCQQILSSGFNYYSQAANSTWNTSIINQTGTLLNSRIKTSVYLEVIDDGIGYGGTETMNLTLPVYSNSTWTDGGVSGYRNIATYYTKQAGRTSI